MAVTRFSETAFYVQMPGPIAQRPLQENDVILQFNLEDKELLGLNQRASYDIREGII